MKIRILAAIAAALICFGSAYASDSKETSEKERAQLLSTYDKMSSVDKEKAESMQKFMDANPLFRAFVMEGAVSKLREKDAKTPEDRVKYLHQEAMALNSLYRPKEAIELINRAIDLNGDQDNRHLLGTKVVILWMMDDPKAALEVFVKLRDQARAEIRVKGDVAKQDVLQTYSEGYMGAVYAYMQLEQWHEAVDTLNECYDAGDSLDSRNYKALLYNYIKARAKDESIVNAELERMATTGASVGDGVRAALLRLWTGEDATNQAKVALAKLKGAEWQNAAGELLFFRGAYYRYVKNDVAEGTKMFDDIRGIAPYGSFEWPYSRRLMEGTAWSKVD